ncbi:glycosyltransferase family 2 protein [Paracoccaceae bacterium]|nr:glycosyltransferase [Paracoccaceae bacterium]MDC0867651.1 glycosyltransferase family 2 protein [Paracoccaceae bacterium]
MITEPTITLITINFNNKYGLERTLKSVIQQRDFEGWEHIIIDGGSTDGSLSVIEKYQSACDNVRALSEKDNGIYDAMNKGINLASGQFICFLNSGDVFSSDCVAEHLYKIARYSPGFCFIYGDIQFKDEKGNIKRYWKSNKFVRWKLFTGWMPPHPGTMIRSSNRELIAGFNEDFLIAGDYDLMLRVLLDRNCRIKYVPKLLVDMEPGGVSNRSLSSVIRGNLEVLRSWKNINIFFFPFWIICTKPLSKVAQIVRKSK